MCVCVSLSEWVFSDHTQQKIHKGTHSFWGFFCIDLYTYLKHHYAQQSLCSFPGHFNESSCESEEKPRGGIFLRGQRFGQSLFIPEKHFVEMKSVIKVRRKSARGAPGELWEELLFPSVGCMSIGWQRRVHLRVREEADAAGDRGPGTSCGKDGERRASFSSASKGFFHN